MARPVTTDMLAYFKLDKASPTGIRWARGDELPTKLTKGWKVNIPFGQPAGGREVRSHGHLVHCKGRHILSSDIIASLHEGDWTIIIGAPTPLAKPSKLDKYVIGYLRDMIEFRDPTVDLVWLRSPHSTIEPGYPVKGVQLSGRDYGHKAYGTLRMDEPERVITLQGVGYLASDIVHVLHFGRFPWEPDPMFDPEPINWWD